MGIKITVLTYVNIYKRLMESQSKTVSSAILLVVVRLTEQKRYTN